MSAKRHFIGLAAAAGLGLLGSANAALAGYDYDATASPSEPRPCSMSGVNPGYHPEIFGNPATARAYGFVQSSDGSWHSACGGAGARASVDEGPPRRPLHHRTKTH
jgi:hypothetical protein